MKVAWHSPRIMIALPANPTTGFQWTLTNYDKSLLTFIRSQYVKPHTRRIGAGGEMQFIFSPTNAVNHPKSTTLLFRYARPWERQGHAIAKKVVLMLD